MKRWIVLVAVALGVVALIPLALVAKARVTPSTSPRIHPVQDMGKQPKLKMQAVNPMFADGRSMRPQVAGTVVHGEAGVDEAFGQGRAGDGWVAVFPVPVTERLVRRGQERFDIYCAPCHGLSGQGDGIVGKRADRLQEGTWTPPANLHTDLVRGRSVGQLFNTITNGIRNMPSYGAQIDPADRWAIVAYVRALQRSQDARIEDVPAELRGQLR